MMEAIANIDRRTDPYTRHIDLAMFLFWLGWMCLLAAILSANLQQATGMLVFGIATFGAFFQSGSHLKRAYWGDTAEDDDEADEDADETPTIDPRDLRDRKRLYSFVVAVCTGHTSQSYFISRGYPQKQYLEWIAILEEAKIIVTPGKGAPRQVRVPNVEDALAILAEASGDPEYWKPVMPQSYRVDKNKLLMVETDSPTAE